jgi:hypothetical protein
MGRAALVVAAVDGIEICSSFRRCCDACMQRQVEHKVRGELRTDAQYYHRIVAAVIVSTPFPVPLGIRFQKDGESEVPWALALLQDEEGEVFSVTVAEIGKFEDDALRAEVAAIGGLNESQS